MCKQNFDSLIFFPYLAIFIFRVNINELTTLAILVVEVAVIHRRVTVLTSWIATNIQSSAYFPAFIIFLQSASRLVDIYMVQATLKALFALKKYVYF